MGLTIVPAYGAVLAILLIALSFRVIKLRRALQAKLGDAGDVLLQRAIRAHSNFAEYVPFALLMLAFVEQGGVPAWLVHGLCATLVASRCVHAYGLSQEPETLRFRVAGMAMTFWVLGIAALLCLWRAVMG